MSGRDFNVLQGELDEGPSAPEPYGAASKRLGPLFGASLLGMSVYELRPGGKTFPYHYHLGMEEWLLVLAGRPTLRAPDGEQELEPGDVVVFPEGPSGAHQLRNDGEEPARIAILSTSPALGASVYPDSDKLAVRAPALGARHLVRASPELDYWDGEA